MLNANSDNGPHLHLTDQDSGNLIEEIKAQRKLSDLVLPEEVLQICQSVIKEQEKSELLFLHNLEPRHRVLLIGPPGNGKTSLAEAIACELNVPFLVVRYESVVGTYLGQTAARLKKIFEYAATKKCVLFFDEFETLGKERGDAHETGEIKRVVSTLLMQIDNLPSHVIVMGATNHGELLDRAVWRRFQVRMNLPNPSDAALVHWFKKFEEVNKIPFGHTPEDLAKHFAGANFAEVEEFCKSTLRQYVLDLPDARMKDIVSRTLKGWAERVEPVESRMQ